MPRGPRRQCESNIYHVFARGAGRQLIFENDYDRRFFLGKLSKLLEDFEGQLLAWVLMGNHFHLLVRMEIEALSKFMGTLQSTYARYFNQRYEHDGHFFRGRFGSQAIESDEQLLAAVRYIHRNPLKAGLCRTCDYEWSSYRSYLNGAAVTETSCVLGMFDSLNSFVEFHEQEDDGRFRFLDTDTPTVRIDDSRALELANSVCGDGWRDRLSDLEKAERNDLLRQLKECGLSIRQIERITGIGRGIISRA